MNYSWLVYCFFGLCPASYLVAQSITLTQLTVIPKQTTRSKLVSIDLKQETYQQEPIVLTYEQNDFYIYYQARGIPASYVFQLKNGGYINYEVRTANQYAFFTNVPSGNYEFSVRSVGRPDVPPAGLKLRVESPIWLRWWFLPLMFLYGMLLMGVGFYFLYRYRLRQFMRLHAVRENIARDLHDDMGSYLSSISILSQNVVNLAQKDPVRAQALVQRIGETARQVMDSMGDIIWSVNPHNDAMNQIAGRMRDAGNDLFDGQPVVFSLDVDEALLSSHLPLEQRHDFFLIFKEALTNCAKYAEATHVWVQLQRKGNVLLLTIQDDGVGFDPAQAVGQNPLGGNGLKNMRARANKMGATLTLTSAPGRGTTVRVQIILP